MTITASGNVSPLKNSVTYFVAASLAHAEPVTVLGKFAATKQIPQNKGVAVQFKRPRPFSPAVTPLVEGVTPDVSSFSYDVVNANLKQYGHLAKITDVIEDTWTDPVLNDLALQSGQNIAATTEKLTYDIVKAGTQRHFANGTARTDVNTPISLNDTRAAVRTLQAQKARPISKMLSPSPDYGTQAVEPGYVAICHTDLESDIRNLPGFIPVASYGSRSPLDPNEIGCVERIRFITSPDLSPWVDAGGAYAGSGSAMVTTGGTSADIYPVMIFGQDAYGTVALKGKTAMDPTIIPVGTKDKADPLGQIGYCGWKTWHTAVILNEAWMVCIEVAASALA
jgi:N4-gp56 family major capsid protein